MYDSVDAFMMFINLREYFKRLADVLKIGFNKRTKIVPRRHRIDIDNLISMLDEFPDACPTKFAASTCYNNALHICFSYDNSIGKSLVAKS